MGYRDHSDFEQRQDPGRHFERGGEHPHEFGEGHGPGRGRGGRGARRFERGDLRYVLLEHLAEQPAHGYELIRALEERFHGFYTPSPGTIYPTLQWLEDLGYVTATETEGRKVYAITEAGRGFLADGKARVAAIDERMRDWMGPFDRREYRAEMEAIGHDLEEMAHILRRAGGSADRERLRRVREVIRRARWDMESILEGLDRGASADAPAAADASAAADTSAMADGEEVHHVMR
jgi:DNA-binding PadR family transcriptional regulator